jgi:hypothetical protein
MKKIIKFSRVLVRRFIPKWVRIIRENIYIDIMRFFGKRTSLTMKEFPIDIYGKNAFFSNPFISNNTNNGVDNYCAQIYGVEFFIDYVLSKRSYLNCTSEIIKGDVVTGKRKIHVDCDSLLPISIINKISDSDDKNLKIEFTNSHHNLGKLKSNRFHYVKVEKGSDLTLYSEDEYIVGKPIPIISSPDNTRKKIVLALFIDGLSSEVVNSETFSTIMPNTAKYFENGLLSFDSYSSSNWTLPSVASLFSGLYPKNHKMNDGWDLLKLGDNYKIISEFFSDEGYLTAQICSNFRKNPGYNYVKGFDRTLYKNSMRCDEAVINTIDHLTAFKQRDNFVWLTLFDTHHFLNGLPNISIQSEMDVSLHDYNYSSKKSVHASYDPTRKKIYELELKRIDAYLKILFDYLKDNYDDDDVLVSICSDHGKGFLGESEDMLSEHRIKVPMLFKSNSTKNVEFSGFSQGVDYLPTLLNLAGIKHNDSFDGRDITKVSPKYSLSELIFNNDYYRAVIFDEMHMFSCKSKNKIKTQNDIDYDDCIYKLQRIDSMSNVDQNDDIVIKKYKNILKSH